MSQRQQTGGTLALIVASMIIIIILGIGFFFLAQQLGGGREAQQATDAGNLNVAKTSLIKPTVLPNGATETLTFGGLYTPAGDVNLQIYNRFVGKAMLVALNAQSDPGVGGIATTHAAAELKLVEGDNGIGQRLWQALKTGSNTKGFFGDISNANSIRMLNWNGAQTANSDFVKDEVSFMRQNAKAPTNVSIDKDQFPPNTQTIRDNPNYFKDRDGTNKRFFPFGYTPITIAGLNIYGVPVRPGEQPHLVSQEQFQGEKTSPLANGSNSLLPPNAFMSNSKSREMHGGDVTLRSSAIVGSLGTQFVASIPNGFVVIDNQVQGSPLSVDIPPYVNDIFKYGVMDGVTLVPGAGYMSSNPDVFNAIKGQTGNVSIDPALSATLVPPPTDMQAALNQIRDALNVNDAISCNSFTAFESPCKENLQNIQDNFPPPPGGNGSVSLDNLMSLEWLKAEVLRIRAGFEMDGPGCGFARVVPSCSGLKAYDHNGGYQNVPFGTNGTLGGLLAQSGGSQFVADIKQRMHQMGPEATDFDSAFGMSIPFNTIKYLYFDSNTKTFAINDTLPFPAPDLTNMSLGLPDGTPQTKSTTVSDLNGEFINVPGEQGYPNPWDCPATDGDGHGTAVDSSTWTPSSGYLNLLGVVKFRNCARAGLKWCCPC